MECLGDFGSMPIKLAEGSDIGIYDAMNIALTYATGDYVYFLNCGDYLYDTDVISGIFNAIDNSNPDDKYIIYGDIFDRMTGCRVSSAPSINGFTCYRNVPCHQACFYDRRLVALHPFEVSYKVRADYEQFLWCFYEGGAKFVHKDIIVADYEGGGFSDKNNKISADEHKEIVEKYMSKGEILKYKTALTVSLSGLRSAIAKNPKTAGMYNSIKNKLYKMK